MASTTLTAEQAEHLGLGPYDMHQWRIDRLDIPDSLTGMTKPWYDAVLGGFLFFTETHEIKGPYHSIQAACEAFGEYITTKLREQDVLSDRRKELFDLLQEECGEIVKARSKLRRGGDRMHFRAPKYRPSGPTNIQLLKNEIMDVMVLIDIIRREEGLITDDEYADYEAYKLARLKKYTDLYRGADEPGWEERLRIAGELQ